MIERRKQNKHNKIIQILILILPLLLLWGCGSKNSKTEKYFYQFFSMDTIFEFTLYSDKDEQFIDSLAAQGQKILFNLEFTYGPTGSNSVIFRLNKDKRIELDEESYGIFSNSLEFSKITGGLFDITIYPLMELWGFPSSEYQVPSDDNIKKTLLNIGYKKISLDKNRIEIQDNMEVDLGGILKGYAVDRVAEMFISNGIQAGIVNAGGNLRVFGEKANGEPWYIGIRHPRQLSDIYKIVEFSDSLSIATSGDYQRYFIANGIRYHHIMSPFTGMPANNGVISVSVVNRSAETTDAYATSLFVMGIDEGMRFANDKSIPALFIYETNGELKETNSILWAY